MAPTKAIQGQSGPQRGGQSVGNQLQISIKIHPSWCNGLPDSLPRPVTFQYKMVQCPKLLILSLQTSNPPWTASIKAVRTIWNLAEPRGSYLKVPVSLLTLRRNQPFQEVLSSEVKINYSFGFKRERDTNKIISANASPQVLIRKSALLAEMDILRHLCSARKMRQTLSLSTSDWPGSSCSLGRGDAPRQLLVHPGRMAEEGPFGTSSLTSTVFQDAVWATTNSTVPTSPPS